MSGQALHTPGPWIVAHSPIYGTPFVTDSSGKLSLTGNIGPKDPQTAEANARLVAAAPDLLEALASMATIFAVLTEGSRNALHTEALRIARAAFAAAKGEKGGIAP